MKKGFIIKKLFNLIAIFVFVLSLSVISISNTYALEETQLNNAEGSETIDPVTNLVWVESSSATLSWNAVEEANYYSVLVTVYENNGITIIGSTTTGTTSNQLDVQQEIYDVVSGNDYDYVKVMATVTSQFKQDDVVVKQGSSVTTGLFSYYFTHLIQIPTPTNVVLHNDYSVTFECDMDNLNQAVNQIDFSIWKKDGEENIGICTREYEIEGNKIKIQIPNTSLEVFCRSYSITGDVEIVVIITIEGKDGYDNSDSSERSNSVVYESHLIQIPTPTNVVLHNDYSVTFECDMDNLNQAVNQIDFSIWKKDGEENIGICTREYEIEGNKIKIQIPNTSLEVFCRSYSITGDVEIVVIITIEGKDGYDNSDSSERSNSVVYNGFIPVESIILSPQTPYISKGNSYYLGKTITPLDAHYDNIEWISSNPSIVHIDATGKITGVSAGTATITATIGDISTSVIVTVYEINTNVDSEQAEDLIGEAGDIIDEIINNDNPDYSNTDIDGNNIDDIANEIINGIQFNYEFWIYYNWYGYGIGHYNTIWDYIIAWYNALYGEHNWNFGYGYEIEYEIGYTDNNHNNHHVGNIVEFQNEFNITLDLPNDLPEQGHGKKRNYCLVRCHNGQYETVPVWVDGNGKIHSKSNKYSDFILMYEDIDIVEDSEIYKKETHSISLGENIKINTYLELQEDVTNPVMTLWLDENNKTIVNGSIQGDGRYKFDFDVASPQMSSTIYYTITATKGEAQLITETKTYSVREYCEAILNSDKSQEMKNLAAQMLNYGAYSQIYFGYNIEDLANKNLESLGYSTILDSSVINQNAVVSFKEYDGDIKAQFTTNSLVFESEIALKYYVTLDDGVENAYMAYRVKDSDSSYTYVELTKSGNRYYAKIEGIKVPLLTDVYETFICIKNGNEYQQISNTKYYSPECYATAIYNNSTKQNMINAVVAMMMYCNAAKEYFGLN